MLRSDAGRRASAACAHLSTRKAAGVVAASGTGGTSGTCWGARDFLATQLSAKGDHGLLNPLYEVDPTMTDLDFGCAKSLELAELREANAAIVESSLRWFP